MKHVVQTLVGSGHMTERRKADGMTLLGIGAALLLCLAIGLFGGTILVYLRAACLQPSRIEEIRHLRQEGLTVALQSKGDIH